MLPDEYTHFNTAKELKDFYLEYYSYARKCKSSENFNKPQNSSGYLQNPNELASKKGSKRPDDDDYH